MSYHRPDGMRLSRVGGIIALFDLTGMNLLGQTRLPMSSPSPVGIWVSQLKDGDPQAAQQLWNTYFFRMVKVARCKLHGARRPAWPMRRTWLSVRSRAFVEGHGTVGFRSCRSTRIPGPSFWRSRPTRRSICAGTSGGSSEVGPARITRRRRVLTEAPACRHRPVATDRQGAGSSSRASGCRGMPGAPRSVQRHDPSRHRAVEDGGVHDRGDCFQARLHDQDRRAKAPAHSQALGSVETPSR